MLEGKIENIAEEHRLGIVGTIVTVWIPCFNKQLNEKLKVETDDEYKKRKSEWEHLHIGKVTISQSE